MAVAFSLIHFSHLDDKDVLPLLLSAPVYRTHRPQFFPPSCLISSFLHPFLTVKSSFKCPLPLPNPMHHNVLAFFMNCKQLLLILLGYTERCPVGYHGDHTLDHRWSMTLCLSIITSVSSDNTVMSFKHQTALRKLSCVRLPLPAKKKLQTQRLTACPLNYL